MKPILESGLRIRSKLAAQRSFKPYEEADRYAGIRLSLIRRGLKTQTGSGLSDMPSPFIDGLVAPNLQSASSTSSKGWAFYGWLIVEKGLTGVLGLTVFLMGRSTMDEIDFSWLRD